MQEERRMVPYAVSREWIKDDAKDADALIRKIGREEFDRVTNYIFYDAVEETARLWFKAWKIFTK